MFSNYFAEGGRLQKELRYVEDTLGAGAGATNELIIQTPLEDDGDQSFGSKMTSLSTVLTSEALLLHLEVLRNASKVVVEKEDVTWKLKDLCYAPTIPLTEIQMIDRVCTFSSMSGLRDLFERCNQIRSQIFINNFTNF